MDTVKQQDIKIFTRVNELFEEAAEDFIHRSNSTVHQKGFFTVVLSGGHTPQQLFVELVKRQNEVPWSAIQFFFSDERYVPPDNIESNYHMAYEYLFSKIPIDDNHIHRMETELSDPNLVAERYAETLRDILHLRNGVLPTFDLVYLGVGEDAHTASLMPETPVVKAYANIEERPKYDPLIVSLWVPKLNMYRLTMTPSAINNSQNIIFLVTGSTKHQAVWNILEGPQNPMQFPAQLIHCKNAKNLWYLDASAASSLTMDLTFRDK
ncbi:MAG: 6-phosphogluconolactonase [Gammaproteobacteria bacterium]|nr:6-phosphogluconolactonase [Gammaproteobacteria bacterium]